ncbi:MAG: DUF5118 domain-containing protein, partial [Candidatus Kapabacteria bacterium]|nr:DUF5118 domain-containing protein [Candidatus Kapabacteria bacterium]
MTLLRWFICAIIGAALVASCSSSSSTQNTAQMGDKPSGDKEKKIKAYDKVITKEAVSDTGLFIVYRIDEKYFFEIPKDQLGKEMLLVSRISKTPQVGYGGEENNTEVVRWERKY